MLRIEAKFADQTIAKEARRRHADVLAAVLVLDAIILLASQLKEQHSWAYEVCRHSSLCNNPRWPLLAGIVLGGVLLVARVAR